MRRLFCTLAVAGLALVPLTGQPGEANGNQEAGSGKLVKSITGKLPIGLPGLAERGAGLTSATR